MCNSNRIKSGQGIESCGFSTMFCKFFHFCRFTTGSDGKRELRFNCTYWSFAIPGCLTFPVWGLIMNIILAFYLWFLNVKAMYSNCCNTGNCSCKPLIIPLLCILYLIFFPNMIMFAVMFTLPQIFMIYFKSCSLYSTPLTRV